MTRLEDRQILVRDIAQARGEGARLGPACAVAGVDARTLQRWKATTAFTMHSRMAIPMPSTSSVVKPAFCASAATAASAVSTLFNVDSSVKWMVSILPFPHGMTDRM
jgi:hypothetical protein